MYLSTDCVKVNTYYTNVPIMSLKWYVNDGYILLIQGLKLCLSYLVVYIGMKEKKMENKIKSVRECEENKFKPGK